MTSGHSPPPLTTWSEILPSAGIRPPKPRSSGLTMVLDKSMGTAGFRDFCELCGGYVDFVKLTFGTAALTPKRVLAEKIAIAREHGIRIFPGGTLFEASHLMGAAEKYVARVHAEGFDAVEIADGAISLTDEARARAYRAALDFGLQVVSEVGSKDPLKQAAPAELARQARAELALGARLVIIEGRESGQGVGIYDERGGIREAVLGELLQGIGPALDRVMWEAPQKSQQAYLIQRLGADVNLGNIPATEVMSLEALRNGLRWDTFALLGSGHAERK